MNPVNQRLLIIEIHRIFWVDRIDGDHTESVLCLFPISNTPFGIFRERIKFLIICGNDHGLIRIIGLDKDTKNE